MAKRTGRWQFLRRLSGQASGRFWPEPLNVAIGVVSAKSAVAIASWSTRPWSMISPQIAQKQKSSADCADYADFFSVMAKRTGRWQFLRRLFG